MKPKTKLEKAVADINATLSEDIAITNAELAKKASVSWDMRNFCYFTIVSNIKEYMVRRLYRIYKFSDKNTDHFFFVEIIREFNDGCRKFYFAKHRQMGQYYDCFTYGSDIELRQVYKNYANYDITDLFRLSMESWCEDRSSERLSCDRVSPKELARIICNNPIAENLYKQRDFLFVYLLFESHPKEICRAITLAKRHGFIFSQNNTSLWIDMVQAIIYCKKDWHNPVYIAPKDLNETHDKFIDMMKRKREKEAEELRRAAEEARHRREYLDTLKVVEEDKKINERYIKRRRRFYDMVLTDGLIECHVLPDVQAFKDEADEMKHCVYRSRYFTKPYSLIMSARIGNKRIETVEVNLTDYSIKQCFGKHDHFTMYHERILKLVNSQMDTIRSYNKRRNNKVKKAV